MNILVICQYYYPEPFRIHDLCEELVLRGHAVTVVTGEPNYPDGDIYQGYENHQHADETLRGVRVHRCPIIPRKHGAVRRFLNYYSYPAASSRYVDQLPGDYDVVLVYQLSPVMMARAGIEYSKKHGVPVVMYCMDLWPESLIAGGIDRQSAVYRHYYSVSRKIYREMDRILISSRHFKAYFETEFEIDSDKIRYLPQYAEGVFACLEPKKWDGTCHLVFAGNIGTAQSLDTVLEAAELLKDEPVRFSIVGSGSELSRLKETAVQKQLTNLTFYGRRPLEEMPAFYREADAMLVTLHADPVLSITLPGKVQSYMAVGKPIIGAVDGETADVIEDAGCGFCSAAEDGAALAENIRMFLQYPEKETLGKNARAYYEAHFRREQFMDELEQSLEGVRKETVSDGGILS